MTDPETSGASANAAPAETTGAHAAAGSTQEFGTFGSTRGSGLARGKRAISTAAPAASAPSGEYKPTAIEVVVPQREYKNPFGETTPAIEAAPAPAPAPEAPRAVLAVPEVPQPAVPAPEPTPKPAAVVAAEIEPEKAVLNILPPADAKRPPVHWGNTGPAADGAAAPGVFQTRARREENRGDRPQFRSEPRSEPRAEPRAEPRSEGGYQGREPRRDFRQEPRDPAPQRDHVREPATQPAPAKAGGFFSWLKGLFGGKPAEKPAQAEFRPDGEQFHRRRRRGGRGRRHGEGQQGQGGPPREGDQPDFRGGRQDFRGSDRDGGGQRDGQRRRRHRGGRGRDRGDSRPEGWQGGGAI